MTFRGILKLTVWYGFWVYTSMALLIVDYIVTYYSCQLLRHLVSVESCLVFYYATSYFYTFKDGHVSIPQVSSKINTHNYMVFNVGQVLILFKISTRMVFNDGQGFILYMSSFTLTRDLTNFKRI